MKKEFENLRGSARREFLKWAGAVAAGIGLERTRYFEVLHGLGGYALAQSASAKPRKSIHLIGGQGGLSNFTLAFPHIRVATNNNGNYAHFAPGSGRASAETDNPFYYVDGSPFQGKPKQLQMTAFLCGSDATHTPVPVSTLGGNANTLIASCAAIQAETPSIVPAIYNNSVQGRGGNLFGGAPGAPEAVSISNAAGIAGLFDSRASRGLLAIERAGNAQNVQTLHSALTGLTAASRSPTAKRAFTNSNLTMNLLAQVLGDKIRPTQAQLAMYGFAQAPPAVQDIINATASIINAMGLGLTRMLAIPAFNDDPHGMFSGGNARGTNVAAAIGRYFEGILAHGGTIADPDEPGRKLSETIIVTVTGDTMKQPFARGNWPDGAPGGSNVMYVWGQQYLKKGWFGGFLDSENPVGFNPNTGQNGGDGAITRNDAFASASAAVLYAVAAGEKRRIDHLTRGIQYDGLVNQLTLQ